MKKEIRRCSHCGSTLSLRSISLYRGMVEALWKVFKYTGERGSTRFTRKEIKHLLAGNENTTARFGDWVMFGNLIHKEGKGKYIINREYCEKYFLNEYQIPNTIWKDPISGEVVEREDYRYARDTKSIREFLDEDDMYVARYKNKEESVKQESLVF